MLLDIIFPEGVSRGPSSGSEFKSSIVQFGKRESRNIEWNRDRLRVNVAYGIRTIEELQYVVKLFRLCRGRAHSFKYKDWLDYKSTEKMSNSITAVDQVAGIGDGASTKFVLKKYYDTYLRDIRCPKPGTVRVAIDGFESGSIADIPLI